MSVEAYARAAATRPLPDYKAKATAKDDGRSGQGCVEASGSIGRRRPLSAPPRQQQEPPKKHVGGVGGVGTHNRRNVSIATSRTRAAPPPGSLYHPASVSVSQVSLSQAQRPLTAPGSASLDPGLWTLWEGTRHRSKVGLERQPKAACSRLETRLQSKSSARGPTSKF